MNYKIVGTTLGRFRDLIGNFGKSMQMTPWAILHK